MRRVGIVVAILIVVAPWVSEAQQEKKVYKLGYLGSTLAPQCRNAEGEFDRLPRLAAELVALGVDVMLATSALETSAARRSRREYVDKKAVGLAIAPSLRMRADEIVE